MTKVTVIFEFSAWAGARERTLQTYANFYAGLGYSSIQLGVNLTNLKGFNQLSSQQSFWNNADRQMYTDLMATKFDKFYNENPGQGSDSSQGIQYDTYSMLHMSHPV